jgi:hypothetical protein
LKPKPTKFLQKYKNNNVLSIPLKTGIYAQYWTFVNKLHNLWNAL